MGGGVGAVIGFTKHINGLHKQAAGGGRPVTGLAKRLGQGLYTAWAGLAFGGVTLLTLLLLLIVPGEARRRAVVRRAARLILWLFGSPPRVQGLERLPAQSCVVVANHASYLDGMILTAVLPPRFSFVIKREMTRVPVAHFLLRRIGSQFVERFDGPRRSVDARRIMQEALHDHRSLAFFPEGTFRAEAGLRRFHAGAFQVARRAGKPLVPVVIRGSRKMLPADTWLLRPGRLEVEVLAPVDASAGDSADGLAAACRSAILARLGEPDLDRPG